MYLQSLCLTFLSVLFGLMKQSSGHCQFECPESKDYYCPEYGTYCRDYLCSVVCYKENLDVKFSHFYTPPDSYRRFVKYISISINESDSTKLQTEMFTNYPQVTILEIINTEIRTLLPGTFTGLGNVTELYLNNNHLDNIKSGVFNSMKKLELLDLSFNDITYVDDHAFFNLYELETISLKHNKIASVSPLLFSWSAGLTSLDLSYNLISTIEAQTMSFLHLEQLYLQNNLLKNVSSICTHLSKEISHLDFSNNRIEDYETCLQLKNLFTLKLSSTNLTNLDFLNDGFNNLEELDVSDNNIKEIGHTLTQLKELKILNLSFNKIGVLPIGCFSNLTKLQHLNLSHNEIDELQLGVFQDLTNVNNMDLSHNNLQKLHEECFHVMKNLKYLEIDDNNIGDIDVNKFATGLSLSQVSLGNNKWKCPTLTTVIKNLEKLHITITVSSERKRKNIYGIFCEDGDDPNTQIVSSGTTTNNTLIKQQLVMPNLDKFDENFKKTAFFEMAKKISTGNIVDVKKFDDNFKNTEFYNFIKGDLMNNNFSAIMKRFDGAFANTLVYKSLQKEFLMKKLEELAEKNVNESELDPRDNDGEEKQFQKYLDDGFRNSTFYKYFEQFSENPNDGVAEKLVQYEKNVDYSKHIYTLLIFVVLLLTLLTLIVLILSYEKYQNYRRIKFNTSRHNDTSSGILMT